MTDALLDTILVRYVYGKYTSLNLICQSASKFDLLQSKPDQPEPRHLSHLVSVIPASYAHLCALAYIEFGVLS